MKQGTIGAILATAIGVTGCSDIDSKNDLEGKTVLSAANGEMQIYMTSIGNFSASTQNTETALNGQTFVTVIGYDEKGSQWLCELQASPARLGVAGLQDKRDIFAKAADTGLAFDTKTECTAIDPQQPAGSPEQKTTEPQPVNNDKDTELENKPAPRPLIHDGPSVFV